MVLVNIHHPTHPTLHTPPFATLRIHQRMHKSGLSIVGGFDSILSLAYATSPTRQQRLSEQNLYMPRTKKSTHPFQ